jgi:hypothetical protein
LLRKIDKENLFLSVNKGWEIMPPTMAGWGGGYSFKKGAM